MQPLVGPMEGSGLLLVLLVRQWVEQQQEESE
jgi:hypothetical protein